jgi:hypothetical protein
VRVLTSLLLLVVGLGSAWGDGFGRFGYKPLPNLPGFILDQEGFSANSPGADRLSFGSPGRQWKPVATDENGQSILVDAKALGPQKVKYKLFQPGFDLYFDKGMQLNLGATGCPYLTWGEGTVTDGVPTPDTPWVLISFKTAQPPLLLVVESGAASFQIKGQAGAWRLGTDKPFQGWIRVIEPLGTAEVAANSAASLGQLNKRVFENVSIWTQKAPELLGLTVDADATSVEATWKYDRPGAIVPIGAALAKVGGYPIRILSKIRRLSEWNEEGPIAVTEEPLLKIRFPIRRIPLGRSVTLGKRLLSPIGTVSPIDIPSIVELGLENLLADRDIGTYKVATDTLESFLGDAAYTIEPITMQQLPFSASGEGLDLAACHALLMQATTISNQSSSEANSLFTSVVWRRDAYSWRLSVEDSKLARRAGALASIAGFLCPEPERRLQASMFEAGLAAERGLGILRSRRAGTLEPMFTEPLDGLRKFAFYRDIKVADEDPFGRSLLSDIRVFGDSSVTLEAQGEAQSIQWQAPDTLAHQIIFATAYPIDLELGNMKKLDIERALGLTQVRYVANQPGPCFANLRKPEWAKPIPATAAVPKYSEPVK